MTLSWYRIPQRLRRHLAVALVLAALAGPALSSPIEDFAGRWTIDGINGEAVLQALPQDKMKLLLPDTIKTGAQGDIVLSRTSPETYNAKTASNSEITVTLLSPDKASLTFTVFRNKVSFTMARHH